MRKRLTAITILSVGLLTAAAVAGEKKDEKTYFDLWNMSVRGEIEEEEIDRWKNENQDLLHARIPVKEIMKFEEEAEDKEFLEADPLLLGEDFDIRELIYDLANGKFYLINEDPEVEQDKAYFESYSVTVLANETDIDILNTVPANEADIDITNTVPSEEADNLTTAANEANDTEYKAENLPEEESIILDSAEKNEVEKEREEVKTDTVIEEATVHIHNYVLSESLNATCSSDGMRIYICSSCQDAYEEIIRASGLHSWEEVSYGYRVHYLPPQYVCNSCGKMYASAALFGSLDEHGSYHVDEYILDWEECLGETMDADYWKYVGDRCSTCGIWR